MISLFGKLCLLAAMALALLQCFASLGIIFNNAYCKACVRPAAIAQLAFILAAFIFLICGFISNDFTLAYVAQNSHPSLPIIYRMCAAWGGHEGSILLWILLLNVWTNVYACVDKRLNAQCLTLSILGFLSFCFLCFLYFLSNPFTSANYHTPSDLNPLLQDPGFVIHPPFLYLGYVGFVVSFAITLAALINNSLDATWAHLVRLFALLATGFLSIGITLGSWWAYRVLGWGGFWFWDPVENASLLPWLTGIALIHVISVTLKKNIYFAWSALLSLIAFALSLIGTFLVRSGILVSVHAFASDPGRGNFLLLMIAGIIFSCSLIYLWRLKSLSRFVNEKLSTEQLLLFANSLLFFFIMLSIFLGTIYPLLIDFFAHTPISVGAPYFNLIMIPFLFLILIGIISALFIRLYAKNPQESRTKLISSICFTLVLIACIDYANQFSFGFNSLIILFLSGLILCLYSKKTFLLSRMGFAHLGFALFIIGIVLSHGLAKEKQIRMNIGDEINIGPYHFLFLDTRAIKGSNYHGIEAAFEVNKNGHHITNLYPEKRIYNVRDMVMSKVAIDAGIFRDLYIALGEPYSDTEWSLRIYYKPFIRFIWLGALMIALSCLSIFINPRKKYV